MIAPATTPPTVTSEPTQNWTAQGAYTAVKDYTITRIQTIVSYALDGYKLTWHTGRNIMIGTCSVVALGTLVERLQLSVMKVMERAVGPQPFSQDAIKLFQRSFQNPVFRTAVIAYVAVLAPLFEEITCRGEWQDKLTTYFGEKGIPPFTAKLCAIVSSALCFAILWHISPFQNITTNVVLAVTMFVMGLVLSVIRELTGDLWASTTCHMLYNSIALHHVWSLSHR